MRQVSGNTLQQVEKFKYLGVVFTSDWRRSEEIDTRIDKSAGVLSLCSHKMRAFKHRKTVSFQSVFVPILTYGRESWVMTERILTQVQAPKMGFLRRVHCVTKGRTEVRLGPGKETSLAPPYLNLRSFGSKCTALKKNLRHCWDFLAPLNDSAPGHCAPLVTPLVWHYRDNLAALKLAEPWMSNHFSELREHNYVSSAQGRSQQGGSGARSPIWNRFPPFLVWPTAYCIHPILHFKNMASPFGFWPLLLLFGPPAAKPWRRAWFGHVSRMPHERLVRKVLLSKPTRKRPRCRPRTSWIDYISDPPWSHLDVEPAELSEIAVDREVFQVLRLLPHDPPNEEKQAWK